jgi:hypothetical protein
MDGLKLVTTRKYTFAPDEFYEHLQSWINEANPAVAVASEFRDFPVLIFPLRVYQRIEELRHGASSGNQQA